MVNLSQDDIALVLGRQMLARIAAEKRISQLEQRVATLERTLPSARPSAVELSASNTTHIRGDES